MVEIPCILPNSGLTEYLYTEASSEINTTHLGGLYNSIFPYDLSQITNAKDFHFSVELDSSDADIHIFLHTPTLGTQCIHSESIHSARSKLRIPLFEILPGQRLTASIQTPEPHSIVEAQWSFSSKHKSDVKLGVVICTYNNEELLKKNIRRLIDSSIWENSNIELLLSNNGILEDTSFFVSERCHRFDQQNVGGSGGFARGIYEILHGRCKSLGITHILLMDDDVEFHPEVIQRTINYHQRCVKPCVIGGSMLQLENPTWLHEAGCLVKSKSSIGTHTDITKGLLSETNALDQLGRAKSYDYNAWWFCSFPVDAARKVGLPLPLFIHGDDIEYGMRLKEHGYPVYCPGGISVWHQSFENKHLTWIRYFDFRNALIRITYHQRNSTKTLILQLMNACRRATIRNDYGGFIMALKAFEDFAKGPSVLHDNDFKTQIESLNTLYREFSGVEGIARYKFPNAKLTNQKQNKVVRTLKHYTTNLQSLPIPSFRHYETDNTRFHWTNVPLFADISVKLTNGETVIYRRDHNKYRVLKSRLNKLLNAYSSKLVDIQEEWRKEQATFQSAEFWRKYTYQNKK